MKHRYLFRFLNAVLACSTVLFSSLNAEQLLTIESAWERIISSSPDLKQKWADVWIQEGTTLQSSLSPNPAMELNVSDVGGNKERTGWRRAEYGLSLSQLIETAGKRKHRETAAEALRDVALWDAEIYLLQTHHALHRQFAKIAFLEEKLDIFQKKQTQSQQFFEFISERHQSGKDTFLQKRMAHSHKGLDAIAVRRGVSELEQEKIQLAKLWGAPCADFNDIEFDIYTLLPPPDLCHLVELTKSSPHYLRLQQLTWAAQEELTLQHSLKYTDVATYGGIRQHHDHSYNFFFGAAIDLPINNRNQGNILSASSGLAKAQYLEESGLIEIQADLTMAHQQWELAYEQALDLKNYISDLEETIAIMQTSFNEGKLSLVELSNTQNSWFDAQSNLLDALLEMHLRHADVERLLGIRHK